MPEMTSSPYRFSLVGSGLGETDWWVHGDNTGRPLR